MSLILDALKRARELAAGKNSPVQAETLFNSFGFRQPTKQDKTRRILIYLLPLLLISAAIAVGVRYWTGRQPHKIQTLAVVRPPPVNRIPEPQPAPAPPLAEDVPHADAAASTVAAPPKVLAPLPALPLVTPDSPRTPPARSKSVLSVRSEAVLVPDPPPLDPTPRRAVPQSPAAASPAAEPPNESVAVSLGTKDPWELANGYYRIGKFEMALVLLKQMLEKDPLNPRVLNNIGVNYLALGKNNEAISAFRSATLATPGYDAAHNNLGTALMNVGQYSEAEREFTRALSLNSRSTEALINLGRLAKSTGNPEKAKNYYLKALQINGSNAEAHYNIAQIYEEQGENGQAVEHYRTFLNLASQQYASIVPGVEAKIRELSKSRLP